jgi:hypothetical protein
METNENLLNNELQIDPTAAVHLKEAAMWGRFLGIVGFIISALLVIVALFAGTLIAKLMSANPYGGSAMGGSMGGIVTVLYLIIAAITFFISLLMYRFGARTKTALLTNDQSSLNGGFSSLKILLRVYGIVTIIYLGFLALALIVGIAGAAFSSR